MSLPKGFISWLLVGLLSIAVIYQYVGANKAEHRAEQLESVAKSLDAQLKDFEAASVQREAKAEARYQASLTESIQLRAILAKGSQARPQNAPGSGLQAILATQQPAKGVDSQKPAQPSCEPFIYQGAPLLIESFQVSVCDQQPVVQAEAAIALHDEKALVDKLTAQFSEATAKLAIEDKDLAAYKQAEQGWKKAAKKSRIKRVVGVAEKVGLFVGGIYLGRKL